MANLKDLIVSRVRVKMLELFFTNSEEMYYVREITRNIKEEINAVRRELDRLLGAGLLKSEQRGNRLYYFLNKKYLYFQEFEQIIVKSTGLGKKIRRLRRKLGQVEFVMFSGKYVRGLAPTNDEVEVLVIGDVVISELQALMKDEEKRLGREVNYAVFDAQEFNFRKTRRDPFIMEILYSTRVMVLGNEDEFAHRQVQGL
ncbi:MAG: winged helix-turn-helix transcriptional regulator [Candidatus Pacebacteria bacterium]|jgi:DNA-binding transcriptional ArsR family regulator|nr:winged helix-turn-helix transcriptional regulator [Candidatus Paceibacterota bacterium]MBT4651973.1 winged helix-turn-helix transcriptional regulator [Candidatus Paceibacterota bacterium]MBT6755995.1 winged helix-turn-helix transcriptional regulator [Candidatus Paceibacterota bacterium]MBT6920817.1 winged helix-turn-helix transcriptional regulator [Candidatus Paceibacterota bacterium]